MLNSSYICGEWQASLRVQDSWWPVPSALCLLTWERKSKPYIKWEFTLRFKSIAEDERGVQSTASKIHPASFSNESNNLGKPCQCEYTVSQWGTQSVSDKADSHSAVMCSTTKADDKIPQHLTCLWHEKYPCFVCSCFWGFVQKDKKTPPLSSSPMHPVPGHSSAMGQWNSFLQPRPSQGHISLGLSCRFLGTEKSTLSFKFQSAKQSHPTKPTTNER